MADVTIKYRGSDIATMNASGTKTLDTGGKYCDSNIVVEYTKPESGGIEVIETPDSHGGTIVEITAVEISGTKTINENGTGIDVKSYASVDVNVPQGVVIPSGYALYNGYLLPQLPTVEGYPYVWIRKNEQTEEYDAVYGTDVWYAASGSTLDGWRMTFANQSSVLSRIYSTSQSNPSVWEAGTSSANYYGTTNDRKVIWSSHDVKINSASGNTLYKHGDAIYPTT